MKSGNNSITLKRLIIYLVLSFSLAWIPWIILNDTVGFEEYFLYGKKYYITVITLFAPAIANLLTRLITGEGLKDSFLHLRLRGNIRWYLLAVAIPIITGVMGAVILTAVYGRFDFYELTEKLSPIQLLYTLLTLVAYSAAFSFITFGEEFGWRAYMNPKLESLIGAPATVIVGGIIWGVWHAPLTAVGHNFGTDYPGFPWAGILLMCLLCTAEGAFLMWLTKKSGSVYPAAIWHSFNNLGGSALTLMLSTGIADEGSLGMSANVVATIPSVLLAILFTVLMTEKPQKKAARI